MMNLKKLRERVEGSKEGTVEWRTLEGVYMIGKSYPDRSFWMVGFVPYRQSRESQPSSFEHARLEKLIARTWTVYPAFYAWLVKQFRAQEDGRDG